MKRKKIAQGLIQEIKLIEERLNIHDYGTNGDLRLNVQKKVLAKALSVLRDLEFESLTKNKSLPYGWREKVNKKINW